MFHALRRYPFSFNAFCTDNLYCLTHMFPCVSEVYFLLFAFIFTTHKVGTPLVQQYLCHKPLSGSTNYILHELEVLTVNHNCLLFHALSFVNSDL